MSLSAIRGNLRLGSALMMRVLSRNAAEAAGLDLGARDLHECTVKGRQQVVQFYVLKAVPELMR